MSMCHCIHIPMELWISHWQLLAILLLARLPFLYLLFTTLDVWEAMAPE